MQKLFVENFSLKHTFECGQFFLYKKIDEGYVVINGQEIFYVLQKGDFLFFCNTTKKNLVKFFNLNYKINFLKKIKDKYVEKSLAKYWGLRIVSQDLFQAIVSFICSQNSNIKKIQKSLFLICKNFGQKIKFKDEIFYLFPLPQKIINLEKLRKCGVGYRLKFIVSAFYEIFKNKNLLKNICWEKNFLKVTQKLCEFSGIGEKVANCISLFSLNFFESFPIDTWVKKIFTEHYRISAGEIYNYAHKKFGKNKGIVQQYLFHYFRNQKQNL